MPPANGPVFATAGIVVVSLAAAAAIAIYESPEVRQFAIQCRRRVAVAVRDLHAELNGNRPSRHQEPRFNRPEDAEGFMQSSAGRSANNEMDADEESRKRQREELMYWNRIRLEKLEKDKASEKGRSSAERKGSRGFDDFLEEDHGADEKGAFIYNTGAEIPVTQSSGDATLRRRGAGERGLERGLLYANPFADEFSPEMENDTSNNIPVTHTPRALEMSAIPVQATGTTDLYGATDVSRSSTPTLAHTPTTEPEQLIDVSDPPISVPSIADEAEFESAVASYTAHSATNPFTDPSQSQDRSAESAYESIAAWADSSSSAVHDNGVGNVHSNGSNSVADFYSPLPHSPRSASAASSYGFVRADAVDDDEEENGEGMATPTDSMSIVGGEEASDHGVVSEDESGMMTPNSWSEVGSVSEDSDFGGRS